MLKKTIFFLCLFAAIISAVFAEAAREEPSAAVVNENTVVTLIPDMSYAFGMVVAEDLKQTGLVFEYNSFMRGFREVMENWETGLDMEEAYVIVDNAIQSAMAEQAEANARKEAEFLAQNARRPGVYTTNSGLQYEIVAEGKGRQPSVNDVVKVHYTGCLIDGTVFDSSRDFDEPVDFPLQGVIPGWSEGLQLMREGGKSRFFIPSKLAYGSQGAGGFIPPNSVIVFEVELFEIIAD